MLAKKMIAGLGVFVLLAAGVFLTGATPAKADGAALTYTGGHIGFGLSIGTPYYAPAPYPYPYAYPYGSYDYPYPYPYEPGVVVAPSFSIGGGWGGGWGGHVGGSGWHGGGGFHGGGFHRGRP